MKHTALIGHHWNLCSLINYWGQGRDERSTQEMQAPPKVNEQQFGCGESGVETHMQDRQYLHWSRKLTCIKACIWSVTAGMMALALSMISRTKEDTACSSLMLKKKRSDSWKMRNQLVEGSPDTSAYNSYTASLKIQYLFTTLAFGCTDGLVVRRQAHVFF